MERIKLSAKNLLRYGTIVMSKEWTTVTGSFVTQRYIIWETDKMNGVEEENCNTNKNKMLVLTMVNGEEITMKQV